MGEEKEKIKYTVFISDSINGYNADVSHSYPQKFYMHSNDELIKFMQLMVVIHKKNVKICQGER